MAYRYPSRFTVAGTTVIANNGTVTLIAAPGAGTAWVLGGMAVSAEAGGGFKGILQDGDGTEVFTFKQANMTTEVLSIPASSGLRAPAANKALQLVNKSGVGGTLGVVGFYRLGL